MIYVRTKFHTPFSNSPLVVAIKPKARHMTTFRVGTSFFLRYPGILQTKAEGSLERLVIAYKTTRCHSED
jgi:hypothetical protein